MTNAVLMSHNSWTYLEPKTWLGKLFKFTAKCQSYPIKELYEKFGVRVFDLRIKLNKKRLMVISHGKFNYKGGAELLVKDLDFLNKKGDASVRVLWEVRMYRYETEKERQWYINYCKHLEETYPNIVFFGGNPTHMCYQYYHFNKYLGLKIQSEYASKSFKLLAWWPRLYSKFHNNKIKICENERKVIAVDFVEYPIKNIKL